jgi:hypothetical protein
LCLEPWTLCLVLCALSLEPWTLFLNCLNPIVHFNQNCHKHEKDLIFTVLIDCQKKGSRKRWNATGRIWANSLKASKLLFVYPILKVWFLLIFTKLYRVVAVYHSG